MKYLITTLMTINNKLLAILAVAISIGPMAASADPLSVTYDFTASNFSDGIIDGTPPPVDSVAGSFGFTFEPGIFNLEIAADFVNLSILGFDYTIDNTVVGIFASGSFAAIIFGGLNSGSGGTSAFTNDFVLKLYSFF